MKIMSDLGTEPADMPMVKIVRRRPATTGAIQRKFYRMAEEEKVHDQLAMAYEQQMHEDQKQERE